MTKRLQVRVTLRALPNRADTDGDGRKASKELSLGSDGFQPDPRKARRRLEAKRVSPNDASGMPLRRTGG